MIPDPSRRAVLVALAGFAGCAETPSGDRTDPTRTDTESPTTAARTRCPTGISVSTLTAGPLEESRFVGQPCPPMLEDCNHETTAETPVFLRPSVERVELGRTFGMSLVDRSDVNVFFGPYHWRVWREEGGEWRNVDPREEVEDLGAPFEVV